MQTAVIWIWSGVLLVLIYGFLSAEHVVGGPGDIGGAGILLLGVLGFLVGIVLMLAELIERRKRRKI
jgi:hypothetical protein